MAVFAQSLLGSLAVCSLPLLEVHWACCRRGSESRIADKIRSFQRRPEYLGIISGFSCCGLGLSIAMWAMIVLAYLETMWAFVRLPAALEYDASAMHGAHGGEHGWVDLPAAGDWLVHNNCWPARRRCMAGSASPQEPAAGAGAMLLVVTFLSVIPVGLVWSRFEHVSLKSVAVESEHAEETMLLGHTPIVEESTVPPSA